MLPEFRLCNCIILFAATQSFQFMSAEFDSMFKDAIARMESLGGQRVEIDFAPFSEVAGLLYGGALVAERLSGLRKFLEKSADPPLTKESLLSDTRLLPVIAKIFSGGGVHFLVEPLAPFANIRKFS